MEFTTKRIDSNTIAIFIGGEQVGTFRKESYEQQRPIKGTRFRYARGKMITCYTLRLRWSAFTNPSRELCESSILSAPTTLKGAKADLADRLARLNLA